MTYRAGITVAATLLCAASASPAWASEQSKQAVAMVRCSDLDNAQRVAQLKLDEPTLERLRQRCEVYRADAALRSPVAAVTGGEGDLLAPRPTPVDAEPLLDNLQRDPGKNIEVSSSSFEHTLIREDANRGKWDADGDGIIDHTHPLGYPEH